MPGTYPFERRLGAFPRPGGTAEFRVWAPARETVRLRVGDAEHAVEPAGYGILEATVAAAPGDDYAYVIEDIEFPDPASRWQPHGLRGRSRVVDGGAFAWTDEGFEPPALRDTVLYELHVGTFTPEGTFEAAIPYLRGLRELGVTTIELMPVAAFPGRHGWGYDGVYLSAAHDPYGGPLGLQRLVDAAHGEGLAVVLDVVYNHVGASGTQGLEAFGPYFTSHYETPWGRAMNYDDADSDAVREWVLQSAEQWIRDFHLDGLRLDAIHSIDRLQPGAPRGRHRTPRARGESAGAGDRRVRHERPEGGHRVGLRRGLGGRLPPRAARAADRRPRRLLRGVRDARRAGQGAAPPAFPRRHATRRSAAAASARPRAACRRSASSCSRPTTTRSATARSATACRPPRARSPRS